MGLIRLLLALAVLAEHGAGRILGLPLPSGGYATDAFFIISGFYMAMVLNEGYGSTRNFYATRALRIYPVYYVGLLLAVGVHLLAKGQLAVVDYYWLTPSSKIFYTLSTLTIFGQDLPQVLCLPYHVPNVVRDCSRLYIQMIPPAWSLGPELLFYLAAPFIVRSRWRVLAMALLGALYLAYVSHLTYPLLAPPPFRATLDHTALTYYMLPAPMLFFALGALSYHLWQPRRKGVGMYAGMLVLGGLMGLTSTILPWAHALLFALAVPGIFRLTRHWKWDRWLGELSYPIYILHIMAYGLFMEVLGWHTGTRLTHAMLAVTLPLSVLVLLLVDRPLTRWRHKHFPKQAAA